MSSLPSKMLMNPYAALNIGADTIGRNPHCKIRTEAYRFQQHTLSRGVLPTQDARRQRRRGASSDFDLRPRSCFPPQFTLKDI